VPDRQIFRERAPQRPQFRCVVCRRFVVGTEHRTCPHCGWTPPVRPRDSQPLARREARSTRSALIGLIGLVALVGLVGLVALVALGLFRLFR
jgi:hypothetical protein